VAQWVVSHESGPIAGELEREAFTDELDGVAHVPEQLYVHDVLRIRHARSDFEISFDVQDALKQWAMDENEPVNVSVATEWQRERQDILRDSKVEKLAYDWTYTTSYSGRCSESATVKETGMQMDMNLLTDRSAELVVFRESPLFISELDDTGESDLTVRIRATSRYWFVLLRFFLRVDGQLVRLRDTRWYWDDRLVGKVLRETRWHQSWDKEVVDACVGGDAAANVLMGMAPSAVIKYAMEEVSFSPCS